MKTKIFDALKREYSSLGLGDEALQARAEMLAALGFVNDDNLAQVVSSQKGDLAQMQKLNDTRVNNAIEKALKKAEEAREAKEKAEKEAAEKAAAEKAEKERQEAEAAKAQKEKEAKEKAEKEAAEKKAAEDAAKAAELAKSKEIPDWYKVEAAEAVKRTEEMRKAHQEEINGYKTILEEMHKAHEKSQADFMKSIQELTGKNSELQNGYDNLLKESEAAKAAKAKADRAEYIKTKANELGIPEWRQAEGFTIADDDDEAKIDSYLSTISTNIKTHQIPAASEPFPLAGGAKEMGVDIASIADAVVKASV